MCYINNMQETTEDEKVKVIRVSESVHALLQKIAAADKRQLGPTAEVLIIDEAKRRGIEAVA